MSSTSCRNGLQSRLLGWEGSASRGARRFCVEGASTSPHPAAAAAAAAAFADWCCIGAVGARPSRTAASLSASFRSTGRTRRPTAHAESAETGADTLFGAAAALRATSSHFLGPNNERRDAAKQADFALQRAAHDDRAPERDRGLRDAAAARLKPLPDAWAESGTTRARLPAGAALDAVFAVGYRQPSDDHPLDIGGGTGCRALRRPLPRGGDARSGRRGEPRRRCKSLFDDSSPGWSGAVVPRT